MKMKFGLISVIFTFFCLSVFAKTGNFEAIQIKPIHHLSPMDLSNRTFAGSICFNRAATQTVPTICGTLSEIQQTHKFRFFFPNLDTEVTSSVTLQDVSLGQNFSYSAAIPAGTEAPVFYIVTELLNENLIDQVRLEKSLEAQIASYTAAPPSSLTQQLASVQAQLLENYPAAVYEWVHPKKGKLNPPLKFTTHNKNYRIEFKFDRPDIFIGEKSKVRFKLKSLRPGAQTQDIYTSRFETTEWHSNKVTANVISLAAAVPETSTPGTRKIEFRTSLLGKTYHYSTIPLEFHHPTLEDFTTPEVEGGVSEKVFAGGEKIEIKFNDPTGKLIQNYLPTSVTRINSSGQALQDYTCDVIPTGGKYTIGINGIAGSESFVIRSQDSNLPEGLYKFRFVYVVDHAYHTFNQEIPVRIDASAPTIQFAFDDNYITNEENFNLPLSVFDALDTTLSVWINGLEIFTGTGSGFDIPMTLQEGVNLITFIATDSQGNQVSVQRSVILDRTPPQLAEIIPAQGQSIATQSFIAKGKANEKISQAFINNVQATIQNGTEFSAPVTAYLEGEQQLQIRLIDLVGNESSLSTSYMVAMPLLHIDLVSITPGPSDRLIVTGAPGSVRPNVTIELDAGFFNSEDIVPNADGSFSVEMDYFSNVELTAKDDNFDFEEVYTLNYNVDTTLSGIVKDSSDVPLPGVKVTIVSSGQTTTTNASGVFALANPALGDQNLKIDGTTVPFEVTNGQKEFSTVSLNVAIGNRQQNVIEKTIYISPKILDGSEVVVDGTSAVTVQSSHAPGVALDIPAGAATFPGGSDSGTINMIVVPADKTSVELPDGIKPDTVVALEPSGLKFSAPVELTLPNTNEFPEGTELVILSKNSETGMWEVDGGATVEGDEIKTKPGQGITHFSEVFAAPFGMEMSSLGDKDRPGIDNQVGQLTTSVSLPSYQRLGNSIEPKLIYKSQWANPHVVVSNVFNLPREYFHRSAVVGGGGAGWIKTIMVSQDVQTWITPDSIDTQLFIANKSSPRLTFRAEAAPEKAVVTYGVNLSDLPSGVYQSLADYEIKYKNLTISTLKQKTYEFGSVRTKTLGTQEQTLIESIFPPELRSFVYHQNKIDSELGAGWKFAATQRIFNPDQDRIMIENEDGSISSYSLKNSVQTVVHDTNGVESLSIQGGSAFYSDEQGKLLSFQEEGGTPSVLKNSQRYQGELGINSVKIIQQSTYCCKSGFFGCERRCPDYRNTCEKSTYTYDVPKKIHGIVNLGADQFLFLDQYGAIFESSGSEFLKAGTLATPTRIDITSSNSSVNFQPECQNRIQNDCKAENRTFYTTSTFWTDDHPATLAQCGGAYRNSAGIFPTMGLANGSLSVSKFNKPYAMISGNTASVLYVADTGNNIVRKVNFNTNEISTIAGNQQTFDNGNGGQAIAASMYHPKGLALDSIGNLYISTENGYVRKVDPSGIISTIAGKPLNQGGEFVESGIMDRFNLKNPTNLILDEQEGNLYVADTGNHRIVKLDLVNGQARVIAGNGLCSTGPVKEGIAALETSICSPSEIALDVDKNLVYIDKTNQRIRKVILNHTSTGIQNFASSHLDNTELTRLADGSFERAYRDGTVARFNAQGFHTATQDLTGRTNEFTYNAEGLLTSITDPTGSESILTYSGDKLTQFTDPSGRATQFHYNGSQLTEVLFPDGTSKSYDYDAENLMTQEIDQRGYATQYTFNGLKKLSSVRTSDNAVIHLTDSQSKTYAATYNAGDRKLVNFNDSNASDLSDTIRNPKSAETTFVKETNGYVSKIIDADDKTTSIDRDQEGRPIKITRPDTTFTEFTYNQSTGDLLTKYESSTDSTESFTYNLKGQLTQHIDSTGKVSTKTYDANTGLLLTETDPRGASVSRTYGNLGLVTGVTNSLNQTQHFEYGADGNLLRAISPMGETTLYTRDLAGNVVSKKNAKNEITQYTVDSFNRLLTVTTPLNQSTVYSYLPTGDLASITNPEGHQTSFEYNSMGRLTKKISPRGQITQLAYDQVGNVIQEITPNGHSKSFEYNLLDQLVKKTLPDNIYNYSYTSSGEIQNVSNNSSSFEYEYTTIHGKKYVSAVQQNVLDIPENVLNYSWDVSGKKLAMESDFISYSYQYNNSGRLQKVTNSKGEQFGFAFDFANRMTSMSRPNGLNTSYILDANSFLTQINHKMSGSTISTFGYQRDQVGNRTSMTTLHGSHSYQYDDEGQLISASHPEAGTTPYALESFAYDSLGNRTQDNQGTYSYDNKKHRLEEDWKYLYNYDLNGNLISKQEKGFGKVWNYSYSTENQLLVAEYFDNNNLVRRVEMTYDALGRRVQKKVVENTQTKIRKYILDGNEIIAELNGNNDVLVKYTHSGQRTDDVLAMDVTSSGVAEGFAPNTGTFYFLKDGLGSIIEIANSAGSKVQHYAYSAFGKILKIEDGNGNDITANPIIETHFTFTGREYDKETGLYFYRARYYDPSIGRFLQEDSHPGDLRNPITTINKYVYGGNSPTMNVDPNGRFFFAAIIIGAVLGGVIADANGGNFLEGALIGAAAGGVGAFVGGAVGLGVGNAVAGAIGGTAGSVLGGVAAFGAGAFVGGSVGGLAGGVVGAGLGAINGRGAKEGLFYGLGLGFSVGAITGGLAGLGSYAYGDFLFNEVDFGVDAFGIRTNSVQRYIYTEAYGTASGLLKILEGPNGTEYLPVF